MLALTSMGSPLTVNSKSLYTAMAARMEKCYLKKEEKLRPNV